MTKWDQHNLQTHFDKRVRKDAACLQEVLGRPLASITKDDYKRESIEVLSTAWICYSGEGLDNRGSGYGGIAYYDSSNYFVDDRLLTTIVLRSVDTIRTCYHEDFNRSHQPTQRKYEQMVRYLEHLRNQRRGNMLRNFSVERFEPPANVREALEAELAQVKAISEKSVPAT
jgi:hypothetical protein